MKIKLLIATSDSSYVEHLSDFLSLKYSDTFEICVCSSTEHFHDLLSTNKFDVALIESDFENYVDLSSIRMPLILWSDSDWDNNIHNELKKICKYQRISSIVGNILESYSDIGIGKNSLNIGKGQITSVWSPCGGVGKTTVALAYAARKVANGKQTVYMNLENFSSTPVYFSEEGKSISDAFEKLESNINVFLMGIRQQDSKSGISYFCGPNNYDDINVLTTQDIETLINASAVDIDELVIDLSSQCDDRIQKIFEISNTVLIVCDLSSTSQIKFKQFMNQHNVAQTINDKIVLVNNKGVKTMYTGINKVVELPFVQSGDPISVYKTLSGNFFEW